MNISGLKSAFIDGSRQPEALLRSIYARIEAQGLRPTWITLVPEEENLRRLQALSARAHELPLFGVPFAIKDNFDVAGMATTAACPAFARVATTTATAVQRLLDAGAILIGKTNMDQFATGLVGTRSPYGACESVVAPGYISGGSSSGSAVAVASGLVSFALGTDTAGSGRVPAAMNQIVGVKPTRGLVSAHGILPACRTLDCVSIFAGTCHDASLVLQAIRGLDARDCYTRAPRPGEGAATWSSANSVTRFRFLVLDQSSREFFGDTVAEAAYDAAAQALEALGGVAVPFDFTPLREAARLLYDGPWVAERLAALKDFVALRGDAADEAGEADQADQADQANGIDPTVRGILLSGQRFSAVELFDAMYRLQELKRQADALLVEADFLLLPTTPTLYTLAEIERDPVALNSRLGYYTNFVNLLDMAAVAVPSARRTDGLPSGVSLIGPAFTDEGLLAVADRLHRTLASEIGATKQPLAATPTLDPVAQPARSVLMAVVGAHLSGQPLNWQMTERHARLVRTVRSHGDYRLYALRGTVPAKPGLVFEPGFGGTGIEVEVWAMPEDTVGSFLLGIPAPLSLGTVILEDGSKVKGFLCEPAGIADADEITQLGGWRNYLKQKSGQEG